jgi:hypothetical protein
MASEVDISNLALSHLGDDATVSSLSPPEGSAQAQHCATFYPIARDSLLEQHDWGFATRREALVELSITDPTGEWQFAYTLPNLCIRPIEIHPPATLGATTLTSYPGSTLAATNTFLNAGAATDFTVETDASGNKILWTNQESAALMFLAKVSDTGRFSPLFTDTLTWYLAAYLAGPVLKGDVGRAEAKGCMAIAMQLKGQAVASDANQRSRTNVTPPADWIAGR